MGNARKVEGFWLWNETMHDIALDLTRLISLRRELHAYPELSNDESETSARVRAWLEKSRPDEIIDGLGGHGLAAVYSGTLAGPTVLVRADLDALPISERSDAEHRSRAVGVSHACGHDGHMTMVAGLARLLADRRPERGRVVLLFQPAEEIGTGALRILGDQAFGRIRPNKAFALHNLPGYPLGQLLVRPGTFAMASVGMIVRLYGQTSHSAYPEQGRSPTAATVDLIRQLDRLGTDHGADHGACMATVIHAQLGDVSFGTSPGEAVVMATLRSGTQDGMTALKDAAVRLAQEAAVPNKLDVQIEWRAEFPVTVNTPECVEMIVEQARAQRLDVRIMDEPIRWSEDFGWFLNSTSGAMFGLGSGTEQPPLHAPDYDFPDELIEPGARLWYGIVTQALQTAD